MSYPKIIKEAALEKMHGDDAIDYPEHLAHDHRTAK